MIKYFLVILILLLKSTPGMCQAFLDAVKLQFSSDRRLMQEKLYVQTDKDVYFTGETVWFKIYDVDASFHQLMNVSKVAYVEVISADHKATMQLKVDLDKGTGAGYIDLPSSITTGTYHFRAYTSWMKNFDADFFFEKTISVINAYKHSIKSSTDTSKNRIQFFPEGGNLVTGLESKIGFSATGIGGKGEDVAGVIIDEHNDTVTRFASFKFGLGQFLFTPQATKNYKAICFWRDGSSTIQPILTPYENGYVMRMSDEGKTLGVQISSAGLTDNSTVYLLVHSRQQLKIAKIAALQSGKAKFLIDKDSLAEGISHVMLFNSNKQPVCERLYFKQPADTIRFQIFSANVNYHLREKINLSVTVSNSKQERENPNASVSVFLLDSLQQYDQPGITSYLLLSSDLKGMIDSPNYYVSSKDERIAEATDNLMLTHGWTRFNWDKLQTQPSPAFEFLPEYNGHIITGRIINKESNAGVSNVVGYLSVPAERYLFTNATADANGRIRFETKNFFGASEIVVQTNHEIDSNRRIEVFPPFAETFSSHRFQQLNLDQPWENALSNLFRITEISRVYAEDRPLEYILPISSDSTAFYGQPDTRYFLDDYTRFTTMEEVLREYVKEVQLRRTRENFHLHALNIPYKLFFDDPPLILIDGVPVFNINKLISFDPLKIKKLEVVARKFYQGKASYSGIVSFSTYQGDLGGYSLDPNALIVRYDGLQINKEFYSPAYDEPTQRKSRLPDFRTTLFWSPNLQLSQSNNTLQFFSSDLPGRYLVLIEGISGDGKPGSGRFMFEVGR